MAQIMTTHHRGTNADDVFDQLHSQIVSLEMLPGTRISEVEIASQFKVSRQPVREAFIRLANLDLLLVRPQRATEVRGFHRRRSSAPGLSARPLNARSCGVPAGVRPGGISRGWIWNSRNRVRQSRSMMLKRSTAWTTTSTGICAPPVTACSCSARYPKTRRS